MIGKLIYEVDFQGNFEDEAWMRRNYEERFDEIRSTVPEDRLVVFKLEDSPGWAPLCEVLGVDEETVLFVRETSRTSLGDESAPELPTTPHTEEITA